MPFERWRYPADWPRISQRIRARARGRCEGPAGRPLEAPGRCGALHGEPHPVTGSKVCLTVAHIVNPDPMDCRDENLAALCNRCHLNHDRPHHIAKAKANRRRARAAGDLFSGPYAFGLDRRRARG